MYAIINIENEREVMTMTRTEFKKSVRTKFHGNAAKGGQWEERVRTDKQGNKMYRKSNKIS